MMMPLTLSLPLLVMLSAHMFQFFAISPYLLTKRA
jgi:hypothetical protein